MATLVPSEELRHQVVRLTKLHLKSSSKTVPLRLRQYLMDPRIQNRDLGPFPDPFIRDSPEDPSKWDEAVFLDVIGFLTNPDVVWEDMTEEQRTALHKLPKSRHVFAYLPSHNLKDRRLEDEYLVRLCGFFDASGIRYQPPTTDDETRIKYVTGLDYIRFETDEAEVKRREHIQFYEIAQIWLYENAGLLPTSEESKQIVKELFWTNEPPPPPPPPPTIEQLMESMVRMSEQVNNLSSEVSRLNMNVQRLNERLQDQRMALYRPLTHED